MVKFDLYYSVFFFIVECFLAFKFLIVLNLRYNVKSIFFFNSSRDVIGFEILIIMINRKEWNILVFSVKR